MKVAAFLTYTIAGTIAVLFVTYGVGQLTPGSPVLALVAGLGLLVVLGMLAWWGFRRALSAPGSQHNDPSGLFWTPEAREMVGRKFTLVGAVLGAGLAVSVVVFVFTNATDPAAEALEALLVHLSVVFMLAAVTSISALFPLNNTLRDAAGDSPTRRKRINHVALGGKDIALDEDEKLHAVRVATMAPAFLPLQNFGFAYLYGSLAMQNIRFLLVDSGDVFPAVLLVFLAVVVVIYIPRVAMQVRHARRYANKNVAVLAG